MYFVGGLTAITVATADHAIAQLWNPHSTQRIKVWRFSVFKRLAGNAGDSFRLRRSSARGTAGSTVTPGIENHSERAVAPVSGALLDLAAFSVQPTLIASSELFHDYQTGNTPGAGGWLDIPYGICVPGGTGLALVQITAEAFPSSRISFAWTEDK